MHRHVKDLMTRRVIAITGETGFKEIALVLRSHGISALPVLDDEGRVIGVVSASDLLLKLEDATADEDGFILEPRRRKEARHKSAGAIGRELMTAPAVTVRAAETVEEAARVMRRHRVKRLPVLDETGRLVGILSRGDLLRVYTAPDTWIESEIRHEVIEKEFLLSGVGVSVAAGVAVLTGKVERRSTIPRLLHAVRHVEGVVRAEAHVEYAEDDLYPVAPVYWS